MRHSQLTLALDNLADPCVSHHDVVCLLPKKNQEKNSITYNKPDLILMRYTTHVVISIDVDSDIIAFQF